MEVLQFKGSAVTDSFQVILGDASTNLDVFPDARRFPHLYGIALSFKLVTWSCVTDLVSVVVTLDEI